MITYRQPFRGEYGISQEYGEKVTSEFHTGIDYLTPRGTEILASADGTVMFAGWDRTGYGFCVIIRHGDGRATLYGHLDEICCEVSQKVSQGDVIGKSGNSGNSTGPHLHFEAREIWNNYITHFNPRNLPLMTVDDSIHTEPKPAGRLPEGKYKVACPYAFIRDWNSLARDRILSKGERVFIYEDVKFNESGLPFRYAGQGRCIAEYDIDGTVILERDNGSEENS